MCGVSRRGVGLRIIGAAVAYLGLLVLATQVGDLRRLGRAVGRVENGVIGISPLAGRLAFSTRGADESPEILSYRIGNPATRRPDGRMLVFSADLNYFYILVAPHLLLVGAVVWTPVAWRVRFASWALGTIMLVVHTHGCLGLQILSTLAEHDALRIMLPKSEDATLFGDMMGASEDAWGGRALAAVNGVVNAATLGAYVPTIVVWALSIHLASGSMALLSGWRQRSNDKSRRGTSARTRKRGRGLGKGGR